MYSRLSEVKRACRPSFAKILPTRLSSAQACTCAFRVSIATSFACVAKVLVAPL